MLTNTTQRRFDVIEVTNEMPINRMGGVGTVMESLMSGLRAEGVRPLWFVTDHGYRPAQLEALLARFPDVVVGGAHELDAFDAPLLHVHSYQQNPALHARLRRRHAVFTVHSLLAHEELSNGVALHGAVRGQEEMIALARCVVLLSASELAKYRALGYEALNPRVRVIHNGVGCAAPYRAPRGRQVLGFCGRLVPRKHPEYVQWMLTEPGFETRRVLIAGRGFSPYARDLLARHALAERVRFLGWCAGAPVRGSRPSSTPSTCSPCRPSTSPSAWSRWRRRRAAFRWCARAPMAWSKCSASMRSTARTRATRRSARRCGAGTRHPPRPSPP